MGTPTFFSLKSTTLVSDTNIIEFTGVLDSYRDLQIVISGKYDTADAIFRITFNNDTTSSYSYDAFYGNGSSASGYRSASNTFIEAGWYPYPSSQATTGNSIINIGNANSTATHKMVAERAGLGGSSGIYTRTGRWAKKEAITSIKLTMSAGNFKAGTKANLFGIASFSGETSTKASGGYVYDDATYWYHAFTASGTFTVSSSLTADILVVAGGGGGGAQGSGTTGGGGGGGGVVVFSSQSLSVANYSCLVGAGGAKNANGENSQFGALTAAVGGGKGGLGSGTSGSGGSGGGNGGGGGSLGAPTSGQGNYGGYNVTSGSGGGGGAGGAGGDAANSTYPGSGGIGLTSALINAIGAATNTGELVGTNYYFAGGGGGSVADHDAGAWGAGGDGGGGRGYGWGGSSLSGKARTGGGGGGSSANRAGNNWINSGGSGVIVIRYAK
jgi:hypothetical protein